MNRRGYTLLELILATGAGVLLLASLVMLWGNVLTTNREASRDQTWLQDDLTVMNALNYMALEISKGNPSSMIHYQFSTTEIRFSRVLFDPNSVGMTMYDDWWFDGKFWWNQGADEANTRFRYVGPVGAVSGYIEETEYGSANNPGYSTTIDATKQLAFSRRPGVRLIDFRFDYTTDVPRAGSANDGYAAYASASFKNYTGIRLQATIEFPAGEGRANKTYTRYVPDTHLGFSRFNDRIGRGSYRYPGVGSDNDRYLYVAGGYAPGWTGWVGRFDADTNTWNNFWEYLPGHWVSAFGWAYGRSSPAVTQYNGKIYVSGGQSEAGDTGIFSKNWFDIYDVGTATWTPSTMPRHRTYHCSVEAKGSIYIIGGFEDPGGNPVEVDVYTPGVGWGSIANMPTAPGGSCKCVYYNNPGDTIDGIFVFSGVNAWFYDFNAPGWSLYTDNVPSLSFGTAGVKDDTIFLVSPTRVTAFHPEWDYDWGFFACCWFWVPFDANPGVAKVVPDADGFCTARTLGAMLDQRYGQFFWVDGGCGTDQTWGANLAQPFYN